MLEAISGVFMAVKLAELLQCKRGSLNISCQKILYLIVLSC